MPDAKLTIREFLERFVRTTDLKDDDDIFASRFVNSLFAMQLITFLENEFELKVEDEDLELSNFNSVAAMTAFIARKKGAPVSG